MLGDDLPPGENQPCVVVSLETVDTSTYRLTLECEQIHVIDIVSSSMIWFAFGPGTSLLLTARESFDTVPSGLPSFSLRDAETGFLLLAHVNVVDLDIPPTLEPDIDLTPGGDFPADLTITASSSSACPGVDRSDICDGEGEILGQRFSVVYEQGNLRRELFDGTSAGARFPGSAYIMVLNRAERLVCADEDCAFSDGGPSSVLDFVVLWQVGF